MVYTNIVVMLKKELGRKSGFSLLEILLALALSSVVLLVGFQLLVLASQANTRTESILTANSIAFAKVQEYENMKFDNIPIGNSSNNYLVEDFSTQMLADSNGQIKGGTALVYAQYVASEQGDDGEKHEKHHDKSNLIKLNFVIDYRYGARNRVVEYGTYIQKGGVGR